MKQFDIIAKMVREGNRHITATTEITHLHSQPKGGDVTFGVGTDVYNKVIKDKMMKRDDTIAIAIFIDRAEYEAIEKEEEDV